jgi:hypothetical protein
MPLVRLVDGFESMCSSTRVVVCVLVGGGSLYNDAQDISLVDDPEMHSIIVIRSIRLPDFERLPERKLRNGGTRCCPVSPSWWLIQTETARQFILAGNGAQQAGGQRGGARHSGAPMLRRYATM